MKWWYVLVLLAGVGIGWWLVSMNQVKKTVPAVNSPGDKLTYEVGGNKIQLTEVTGIVQKWHPETGAVEFLRGNKLETLTVDPAQTVIFIPSLLIKNKVLKVTTKTGPRWQTAFCTGDFIAFGMLRPPSS
jgi:hypothetical protein